MNESLHYNVYDLATFTINRNRGLRFFNLINLKFDAFKVKSVPRPDIVLNISPFAPASQGCYLVDHGYHVKENYLFCREAEGKAGWELEVSGVEEGNTVVNFWTRRNFSIESLINPDWLAQSFLLRIIEYKLAGRGSILLHAAAVSKDGKACLLGGRGGSHKTTLCMDFVRRGGYRCLSDDRVIVSGNKVYGFPLHQSLFDFMCGHLETEFAWTFFKKIGYLRLLLREKEANHPLPEPATAKLLILLEKGKKVLDEGFHCTKNDLVRVLACNNRLEDFTDLMSWGIRSGPFLKCFLAYAYVFPEYLNKYKEMVTGALQGFLIEIPAVRTSLPGTYRKDSFVTVKEIVENMLVDSTGGRH